MLSPSQVRSAAGLDGRSVFAVDPEQARERLMRLAEVKTARVRVGWPNRVTIEIEERPPVVAWNDGGRIWWLSAEGLAYIQHGERPGLVQVVSADPVLGVGEDPLAPVVDPALLSAARDLRDAFPNAAPIIFDPVHGLGFVDPQGWRVYFGDGGEMTIRADVYRAIVSRLVERGISAVLVSVEDLTAPYYLVE